jgi:hypothetical protein
MQDWKFIVEKEMNDGKTLELAWRSGTNLDWVWLDDQNPWHVLYGYALKQVSVPQATRTLF